MKFSIWILTSEEYLLVKKLAHIKHNIFSGYKDIPLLWC